MKGRMNGWTALLLYVGRLIACLHAYMYGNVWHSVVKRNTSNCVCVWVEAHSSAVRFSACNLEMRSCWCVGVRVIEQTRWHK